MNGRLKTFLSRGTGFVITLKDTPTAFSLRSTQCTFCGLKILFLICKFAEKIESVKFPYLPATQYA